MAEVVLSGLDGSNPLGYLAALGCLRILWDRKRDARLAFCDDGTQAAKIHGMACIEDVIVELAADLATWKAEFALELAYTDEERAWPENPEAKHDLKPPPKVMRQFLDEAADRTAKGSLRTGRMVAAWGTEVATDNKGFVKPTAFHFTAGQQQFLKMACQLRDGVKSEDFLEALRGPWSRKSTLPSLSWDSAASRSYALRAGDPSKERRGSVPGAEWLAFVGLSFYAVGLDGKKVLTPGVSGGWKDSTFCWPLWSTPCTPKTIESLVSLRGLGNMDSSAREARGIFAVFESRVLRSDQGGYGSFSPARVKTGSGQ